MTTADLLATFFFDSPPLFLNGTQRLRFTGLEPQVPAWCMPQAGSPRTLEAPARSQKKNVVSPDIDANRANV